MTRPSRKTIDQLFAEHLAVQKEHHETVRVRDLGSEQSLVRDYSGRVVFELLQNALDRAKRRILIAFYQVDGKRVLVVGNDGEGISAYPIPKSKVDNTRRSDFHALLSLHSSSKSAADSVGNKGVGFRSVFSSSHEVMVWSRCGDGEWWGMSLQHPVTVPENPEWSESIAASFYLPEYLQPDNHEIPCSTLQPISDELKPLETLIVLTELSTDAVREVEDTLHQISQLSLVFLERRTSGDRECLKIYIQTDGKPPKELPVSLSQSQWIVIDGEKVELKELVQEKSGLNLDYGEVRVGLPPTTPNGDDQKTYPNAVYWSYLPTEQEAGFGVHIHADFYLSNSRRNLTFGTSDGDDPPAYNYRLLQSAAHAIVEKLWMDPKVCRRSDFWRLANPYTSCPCIHLRHEVAKLLLQEDRFKLVVEASFKCETKSPIVWTVQRYRDFFKALDDWADYAYRNSRNGLVGKQLGIWRKDMIDWVATSKARVLPIIKCNDIDISVKTAIPLPRLPSGSRKGRKTVYLRSNEQQSGMELPQVLTDRGNWVTSFDSGAFRGKELGLTAFSRVNLLGRLRPADSSTDSAKLLEVALKLAAEVQERGGVGSVLERCRRDFGSTAWRFFLEAETDLYRAAKALATLTVPVHDSDEWLPANTVTLPTKGVDPKTWPWPLLDVERMQQLVPSTGNELPRSVTVQDACLLLGIGVVPLSLNSNKQLELSGWPQISEKPDKLRETIAGAILTDWDRQFGKLFDSGNTIAFKKLLHDLTDLPWIPANLQCISDESQPLLESKISNFGGTLSMHQSPWQLKMLVPVHLNGVGFFSPKALWKQPSRGFRSELVPRLKLVSGKEFPTWTDDLGITSIEDSSDPDRIRYALCELQNYSKLCSECGRRLEEVYIRFIRSFPEGVDAEQLPVLTRHYCKGRVSGIKWSTPADNDVWFDDGSNGWAINAFNELLIWSVRKEKERLGEALKMQKFIPSKELKSNGGQNPNKEQEMREAIRTALPDMLAAAEGAGMERSFDPDTILTRWSQLKIEYFDDVWYELRLTNREQNSDDAYYGHAETGDVFFEPKNRLVFDGDASSLMQSAAPLAEALCGNRLYAPHFSQALAAWQLGNVMQKETGVPTTVARMRRDLAISDDDIEHWQKRIVEATLDEEQRRQWIDALKAVLCRYGEIDEERLQLDMPIIPSTWTQITSVDVTEAAVEQALEMEFQKYDPVLQRLVPRVNFFEVHLLQLKDLMFRMRSELLAEALVATTPELWTEKLREKLEKRYDDVHINGLERIRITNDELLAQLRDRLELPDQQDLKKQTALLDKARAYLEGKLLVKGLPQETRRINTGALTAGRGVYHPMTPLTQLVREHKEQLKHLRGDEAEKAVLEQAEREAVQWIKKDKDGFIRVLKSLYEGKSGWPDAMRKKVETLDKCTNDSSAQPLRDLLRVSTYWGNAGFDVLVPIVDKRKILLVEVKRVKSVNSGHFYLSENERVRARGYILNQLNWCLWLVDDQSEIIDVPLNLDKVSEEITTLLGRGWVPQNYMLPIPVKT